MLTHHPLFLYDRSSSVERKNNNWADGGLGRHRVCASKQQNIRRPRGDCDVGLSLSRLILIVFFFLGPLGVEMHCCATPNTFVCVPVEPSLRIDQISNHRVVAIWFVRVALHIRSCFMAHCCWFGSPRYQFQPHLELQDLFFKNCSTKHQQSTFNPVKKSFQGNFFPIAAGSIFFDCRVLMFTAKPCSNFQHFGTQNFAFPSVYCL